MTDTDMFYNGSKLKGIITAQGIRQDWLAERSGISRAHLSRIVNGKRLASREVAERISESLRVPLFLAFDLPKRSKNIPEKIEMSAA